MSMRHINCHIPIKLRITGRPTDTQLDRLGETLLRTLQTRIAFAERTIAERRPVSVTSVIEEVGEPLAEERIRETDYEIPTYENGGRRKRVPMRRRAGRRRIKRLKVKGRDTTLNVYRLLSQVKSRFRKFRDLTSGHIKGNTLKYGFEYYGLSLFSPGSKDRTVSAALGEGVFLTVPLPNSAIDPVLRLSGHGYEFYMVDTSGRLHRTGVRAIVGEFFTIAEGILIYSPRTVYLSEQKLEVRKPRDTAALAKKVMATIGYSGHVLSPGITVLALLSFLEPENLTKSEVMEILGILKRAGRLGNFLNLIQVEKFRYFLQNKGVPWYYVFQNWEPSINDSGLVFAGFIIGVGENFYEAVKLLCILGGSFVSDDLKKDRDELFNAIKTFFENPVANTVEGIKQLKRTFTDKLWNLEFFEAGRILGNVVIVLLTLPSAVRSLPKAARAVAKATVKAVRLTAQSIRALGITAKMLRDLIPFRGVRMVTPDGFVFMMADDNVTVLGKMGKPLGFFSKSEIDELIRRLDEFDQPRSRPRVETPKKPTRKRVVAPRINLDDIVKEAIQSLKEQGVKGLHPRKYGTRLHAAVAKRLSAITSEKGYVISVEKRLSDVFELSADAARMRVSDFLKAHPSIARQIGKLPSKTLKSLVGELRPDLVIRRPDGVRVIWDLTSQTHAEHFSKTVLYGLIGAEDNVLIQFGETYWRAPKPKSLPGPAAVGPSVGAAGKTLRRKEK